MKHTHYFQSGFSLIQGLVIAAALTGTALISTKVLTSQKQVDISQKSKGAIEDYHQIVKSLLNQPGVCLSTLTKSNYDPTAASFPVQTLFDDGALKPIVTTGQGIYNNQAFIQNMNIIQDPLGDPNKRVFEIVFSKSKLNSDQVKLGGNSIRKTVPLSVNVKDGAVDSCSVFSEVDPEIMRKFCDEFKPVDGSYVTDPNAKSLLTYNSVTKNCQLRSGISCLNNRLFKGVNSLGEPICQTLDEAGDMSKFIDNAQVPCSRPSRIGFEKIGNRVRLKCESCTPTETCPTLVAKTPCGQSVSNSCGVSCGTGTQGCIASVDCSGGWGTCDKTCNGGKETYTYSQFPTGSGAQCPHSNGETRDCNTQKCPDGPREIAYSVQYCTGGGGALLMQANCYEDKTVASTTEVKRFTRRGECTAECGASWSGGACLCGRGLFIDGELTKEGE